jgi:hypothetical protein
MIGLAKIRARGLAGKRTLQARRTQRTPQREKFQDGELYSIHPLHRNSAQTQKELAARLLQANFELCRRSKKLICTQHTIYNTHADVTSILYTCTRVDVALLPKTRNLLLLTRTYLVTVKILQKSKAPSCLFRWQIANGAQS